MLLLGNTTLALVAIVTAMGSTKAYAQVYTEPGTGNNSIGTTTPHEGTALDIRGNSTQGAMLMMTDNRPDYLYRDQFRIYANDANKAAGMGLVIGIDTSSVEPAAYFDKNGAHIINQYLAPLIFGNGSAEKMRITADGRVGIGTSAPSQALAVNGNIVAEGSTRSIRLGNGQGMFDDGGANLRLSTYYPTTEISLNPGGNEVLRVKPNGNVGIGTATPVRRLELQGPNNLSASFMLSRAGFQKWAIQPGSTDSNSLEISTAGSDGVTGYEGRLTISNAGNVGIGTTTPSERLQVAGNVKATSFISTSDARLKSDVAPIEGLSAVLKLRGVSYNWIWSGEPDAGVIAQETETVFPNAVRTDPKTGMKAVKYNFLIAPIIEAIKDLAGVVHGHDEQIQALKAENVELRERLITLEEKLSR
jgi:hypothetical protein